MGIDKKQIPMCLQTEWHPTKNGDLSPENIGVNSNRKVWWLCNKLHEYEAVVANRTGRGNGCPFCTGRRPIVGENDLATIYPITIDLWSNENVKTPYEYVVGSAVKIIWVCSNNHKFILPIRAFVSKQFSCSSCLLEENSLAAIYPEIAEAWDYETNNLLPTNIYPETHTKYSWRCASGHRWQSSILSRIKMGNCPICSGWQLVSGINDLATKFPTLAEKWHPTKNGNILPTEVRTKGDNSSYYWNQSCGHVIKAKLTEMLSKPNRCVYCAGQKILQGFNDLATINPRLASEWNTSKNLKLSPTNITVGTGKIVWWKCTLNHEWKASVLNRTKGDNCPYCGNKKLLAGYNDLQTIYPNIASQWSAKNSLTPHEVTSKSGLNVLWECSFGHEWEAIVGNRTGVNQTGCPDCWANSYVSKPEQAIFDYVTSLGLDADQSNRTLIGHRQELDIYVPSKKIAIEYNGIYWHSEKAGKDKTYHYNKWQECKEKGIQLIQIWEDEWNRNPEQIKRMIAHKLGVSTERKVFARKTIVIPITKAEAEVFLNENHVQGFSSGSHYLGLKEKGTEELVAVLVLKKEAGTQGKTLNIIRYATHANVIGGFTKLLSSAEKVYKPESFITFADHGVSDGGLYENNGFFADKEIAPDYMYISSNARKHKFGYRLKRFESDPELKWEQGLTERELASLNGLERIWDAGKTRYRKNV